MPNRSCFIRWACALVLAALIAIAPRTATAQEEPGIVSEAAVGMGSAICTLIYSPLKLTYAAGGLAISSLAWIWTFGDTSVSGPIFRSSVGGDYIVSGAHLRRQRTLRFRGRDW